MNTGLQDAYNLAWKLALVVQGRADAALLDTTSRSASRWRGACSRRPIARSSGRLEGWLRRLLRTTVIARVAAT
jgi:2-polyprenyl-6-methoxyphenol hydroxylase-like FAD-dependent oxidoreductase